jgi:hypothetical protein
MAADRSHHRLHELRRVALEDELMRRRIGAIRRQEKAPIRRPVCEVSALALNRSKPHGQGCGLQIEARESSGEHFKCPFIGRRVGVRRTIARGSQ